MNVLTTLKEKDAFETFARGIIPELKEVTEWNPPISHPFNSLSVRKLKYNKGFRQSVAAWRKISRRLFCVWDFYGNIKGGKYHTMYQIIIISECVYWNYIVFYEILNECLTLLMWSLDNFFISVFFFILEQ